MARVSSRYSYLSNIGQNSVSNVTKRSNSSKHIRLLDQNLPENTSVKDTENLYQETKKHAVNVEATAKQLLSKNPFEEFEIEEDEDLSDNNPFADPPKFTKVDASDVVPQSHPGSPLRKTRTAEAPGIKETQKPPLVFFHNQLIVKLAKPKPPVPPKPKGSVQRTDSAPLPRTHVVSQNDLPDVTWTNRLSPSFTIHRKAHHRSPIASLALSGNRLCTAATILRVWNPKTGVEKSLEFSGSISQSPMISITACEFQIVGKAHWIWCGLEDGQMWQIDSNTGVIERKRSDLHADKIKYIFCGDFGIYSIDIGGVMQAWSRKDDRVISLNEHPKKVDVVKDMQAAACADGVVYIASKHTVKAYKNRKISAEFYLEKDPIVSQQITTITSDDSHLYIGDSNGKVSVVDMNQMRLVRCVSISAYPIQCLQYTQKELWAGYSTGKIQVLAVEKTQPWRMTNEWQGHETSVVDMKFDGTQLASAGQDGLVHIWDANRAFDKECMPLDLLIIANKSRKEQVLKCQFRTIKINIASWNVGARRPKDVDKFEPQVLREWLGAVPNAEVIVVGFQEIMDLEPKKTTPKIFFKSDSSTKNVKLWQERIERELRLLACGEPYKLLISHGLVGLHTFIFVKESEMLPCHQLDSFDVKTGFGGYHGNKGAISVRFAINDTSLCFVNCHLSAGQEHVGARNSDSHTILCTAGHKQGQGVAFMADGKAIADHELCFLHGDLNYRVEMEKPDAEKLIQQGSLSQLVDADQLTQQMGCNASLALRMFSEGPLAFAPTYKYDVGTDNYDSSEKKRVPSWCDRILFRGRGLVQTGYNRYELRASDHRPISAGFKAQIKKQ